MYKNINSDDLEIANKVIDQLLGNIESMKG